MIEYYLYFIIAILLLCVVIFFYQCGRISQMKKYKQLLQDYYSQKELHECRFHSLLNDYCKMKYSCDICWKDRDELCYSYNDLNVRYCELMSKYEELPKGEKGEI